MNEKDQLLHWGVKVLRVVYPLAIMCLIYVAIVMIASVVGLWFTFSAFSNMPVR